MKETNLPERKHPRLKNYDYGSNGSYYITICTIERKCILGYVPRRKDKNIAPKTVLSDAGKISKKYIESMEEHYSNIKIENYVIMPNHIHLLISIVDNSKSDKNKTDIFQLVKAYKRLTSKEIGYQIWQESYYDEIIKDDLHFQNVWEYIEFNECKWEDDKYFLL